MRLRNDKNAINILNENPQYFLNLTLTDNKEKLNKFINEQKPFYLEIGMGKGNFIINQAINNPNINFFGIEKNKVICSKAIKKILATNLDINNLKIASFDANNLKDIFKPHSIDKIFLNFSDPWPKKRHEKNRLTSNKFLDIYQKILKPNALIELKTDNDDFFNYTYEVLTTRNDIEIIYWTRDLYQNLTHELNCNNVMTEYEMRFHSENKNINKIIFKFK